MKRFTRTMTIKITASHVGEKENITKEEAMEMVRDELFHRFDLDNVTFLDIEDSVTGE